MGHQIALGFGLVLVEGPERDHRARADLVSLVASMMSGSLSWCWRFRIRASIMPWASFAAS